MNSPVTCELHDGVAQITMDDGKANVMSLAMLEALHAAFDRATQSTAVVVLRSSRPGIFSAGFDLKVFAAGDVAGSLAMVRSGAELALKLLSFPAPVLGLCAGHAFPMGAFLLLASDVRIGTDADYRIGFNEVAVGIALPTFALELGRSRLHPAWLSRSATTGEMFSPRDAVTAGFLDRVVPPAELDANVAATIDALRRIHVPSHAIVKQRLRAATIASMRAAIDAELTVASFEKRSRAPSAVRLPGSQ